MPQVFEDRDWNEYTMKRNKDKCIQFHTQKTFVRKKC